MSTHDSPVKSEPAAQAVVSPMPPGEAITLMAQAPAVQALAGREVAQAPAVQALVSQEVAQPAGAPVSVASPETPANAPETVPAPAEAAPVVPTAAAAASLPASLPVPPAVTVPAVPDTVASRAAALASPPASTLLGPPVKPAVDPDDDLGWAIGSELEYLEEGQDDWDGPTGDGLDEEEGRGGFSLLRP